ncbi:uncharacterized protein LOC129238116 [Anastrepha obliqua]|uniref:uncharacterized protein LOC129238116 n=1 Tax=Anastrepha obliqua TaxID=95512 RepID=UPI00240A1B3A|nr:uncharacterized protein LOC129238116 [Anastrepha obliqua]
MLFQPIFKNLRFLILLLLAATELQASTLRDEGMEASEVRTKRGHSTSGGAPNDYGPAIKITSSILQLTKATEGGTAIGDIGLEHHETTLEQPWPVSAAGAHLPAAHTVWLELPGRQQDFHLIAVPDVSNDHTQLSHEGAGAAGGATSSSDDATSSLSKGLHTQIVSSGKVVTRVSDNLDFGEAAEGRAKSSSRTSYGR